MRIMNNKDDNLARTLELRKTHDNCSGEERLAVVMIHGIASDSSTYHKLLEYLEEARSMEGVRFVTYDLLGAGKSYASDELEYNYKEQLEALDNSIQKLSLKTPLILIGHSMGALIVTRYAHEHKKAVNNLVLISPPTYTEEDLDNPAFNVAMNAFREAVSIKNREILKDKAFNNSINHIVKNRKNYKRLKEVSIPTTMIYGVEDQIIARHNISRVIKENPKYLKAVKTNGRHGISREKFAAIKEAIEEALNA